MTDKRFIPELPDLLGTSVVVRSSDTGFMPGKLKETKKNKTNLQ